MNVFTVMAAALGEVLGKPYVYGGGHPPSGAIWPDGSSRGGPGDSLHKAKGPPGWDCSALAIGFRARCGAPLPGGDWGADGLWKHPEGGRVMLASEAQPLDLAFYGTAEGRAVHVTVVLLPPIPGVLPEGLVVSAEGGGSSTNGDNPNAFVKLRKTIERIDKNLRFLGVRRFSTPAMFATGGAAATVDAQGHAVTTPAPAVRAGKKG